MPENLTGIAVHDHWKPYYTLEGMLHACAMPTILRELKALVEIEKEDWARKMQQLLRRACHAANLARERGKRQNCRRASSRCSSDVTTPSWPRASRSTRRNPHSRPERTLKAKPSARPQAAPDWP